MKQHLPRLHCSGENRTCRLISSKKLFNFLLLFVILLISAKDQIYAQGTWTPLTNLAPDDNGGVMILLSDGTVMAKTFSGGTDGIGNVWNKLTGYSWELFKRLMVANDNTYAQDTLIFFIASA